MHFGQPLGTFLFDIAVIFLFVFWLWLLVSIVTDLFRRSDVSGVVKLVWCVVLLLLPYLGVFAYLLTQGGGMAERHAARAQHMREEMRQFVGFSVADELKKLDALQAAGSITKAEYAAARARLF